MAKYSGEFKLKVVKAYEKGEGGYQSLSKRYGVASKKSIEDWVNAYREFGLGGLQRSREKKTYTFDFKQSVVELYLTTEVSYQELALKVGMNNPSLVSKWVNDYRIAGPDALRQKQKGRRSKMEMPKKKRGVSAELSLEATYLKQLQDENLKLRIENAYLKELRRLRLEEEALLKKQRERYTASEENSN